MNREKAKVFLPIIKAFCEGKKIQSRCIKGDTSLWWDDDNPTFNIEDFDYRIKPEPKYRPFKNAEECWNECLKHQPFGYIKSKETLYGDVYHNIISVENDGVLITNANKITDSTNSNFIYMFNTYEFIDGAPFGVKVEEDKQ